MRDCHPRAWGVVFVTVVAAVAGWQLVGWQLVGVAGATGASSPDVEVVFTGSGTASNESTSFQGESLKKASISMTSWKLRWLLSESTLSLPLKPGDIVGDASESWWPEVGGTKDCSEKLTTNTRPAGREGITTFQGKVAFPVPIVIGSAAETCYTRGGGTGWYAILGQGGTSEEQADAFSTAYALVPSASENGVTPRAGHYILVGHWDHTYTSARGGSYTIKIDWHGIVDVIVNGQQEPVATSTAATTTTAPTAPQAKATPIDVRREARLKLLSELSRANPFCLTLVAGDAWFIQGVSGGQASDLARIVGDELVKASQRACLAQAKLIGDLVETYDDPPRSDVDVVAVPARVRAVRATSASCSAYAGTVAAFCASFDASIARLLTATDGTRVVADALAATIARESAAAQAHDQHALALQQANAEALLPRFLTAFNNESSAGAAAAALLHRNGVSAALTAPEVRQAQAIVAKRLAALGVSNAVLNVALGSAASPRAISLAASLASS